MSPSVAVAAGDLNGDGHLDLVISGDPELSILHLDGEGNLIGTREVPGGEQPIDFALADLDQDGDLDIVVANHDTDHITLLLGDGRGSFQPSPNSPLQLDVSPHPHAVHAVDLNEDGYTDLVIDHRDAQGVLVLKGLGHGAFLLPGTLIGVGGDPYRGMALGDLDEDGLIDLVTPNPQEVGILLNRSQGGILFEPADPVAAPAPFAVEVGDFNGDGLLDIVSGSDEGSPWVQLFLGDGSGVFTEHSDSPFSFAAGGKNITVGDFNGDGVEDAAVASWQSSEVLILLGGPVTVEGDSVLGGEHPWGLTAGDLNGDGLDDLIIADDGAPQLLIYFGLQG